VLHYFSLSDLSCLTSHVRPGRTKTIEKEEKGRGRSQGQGHERRKSKSRRECM